LPGLTTLPFYVLKQVAVNDYQPHICHWATLLLKGPLHFNDYKCDKGKYIILCTPESGIIVVLVDSHTLTLFQMFIFGLAFHSAQVLQ
jgi:hypothetical protein